MCTIFETEQGRGQMLPYIGLLSLMAVFGFLKYFCRWNTRQTAVCMAGWVMAGLWLLLAMRSPYMGTDLGYHREMTTGYMQSFHVIASMSPTELFPFTSYLNYEYGYKLLNALVGWIWENEQFFLAVCAALSVMPVAQVILKKSDAPLYSCLIYFALPVYELLFSGLRQGISIGLCFLAVLSIQDHRPVRFALTVLFASLFHSSSLVFLLSYPIYHVRIPVSIRFVSIAAIPAAYLMRYQILDLYAKIFNAKAMVDDNGALGLLFLLSLIYLVCSFFNDVQDDELNGYMNLFLVCCIIQAVANINASALRMGYSYLMPLVLIIPRVFEKMEWRIRVLAKWTVVIFFTFFVIRTVLMSSWSCMYPYIPFWKDMI